MVFGILALTLVYLHLPMCSADVLDFSLLFPLSHLPMSLAVGAVDVTVILVCFLFTYFLSFLCTWQVVVVIFLLTRKFSSSFILR